MTWVLPNTNAPWLAFHKDAWIAIALLVVSFVLLVQAYRGRLPARIDLVSALFVFLSFLTGLQWYLGIVHFSGHALVGASYFLAAGVAIILGCIWERLYSNSPGDFFFSAFLMAALMTAGIMLIQWLQIEVNEVWIVPTATAGRQYANLVQPNHASTILLLGMTSLIWFQVRGLLRPAVGSIAAVFLLFFLVLTGSRMGYLSFLLAIFLYGIFTIWTGRYRGIRYPVILLTIMAPIFLLFITHDWGSTDLQAASGAHTVVRPLAHERLMVYSAYMDAAMLKPWLGYGFEQGALTQISASTLGHELPALFTWSHNAFLDLATWFGIPVGVVALLLFIFVLVGFIRARLDSRDYIYLLAVYFVFMQGMVELQLAYAYFLLPICFLFGAAKSNVGVLYKEFNVGALVLPVSALAIYMAILIGDYLRVERAFYTYRFELAKVGAHHPNDVPSTFVLNQFESLLRGLRAEDGTLSDIELENFRQAVFLEPSPAALNKLARHQVERGLMKDAQVTANISSILIKGQMRQVLSWQWQVLAKRDERYRQVQWSN